MNWTPVIRMVKGVQQYTRGGAVKGGPPGVDTVPAKVRGGPPIRVSNEEYILPEKTADALGGKPALDELVVRTTGKAPVGYASGGRVSGWNVNRAQQIDYAVNSAMGKKNKPTEPATSTEPKEDLSNWKSSVQPDWKPKPLWKRMFGMARGGQIPSEKDLEQERMRAIDPRYAIARATPTPQRYALPMSNGNLIAEPAIPGKPIASTPEGKLPDFNAEDLARSKQIGQPAPSDVRSREMWSRVESAPTAGLKAHEFASGVGSQLLGAATEMAQGIKKVATPVVAFGTEAITGTPYTKQELSSAPRPSTSEAPTAPQGVDRISNLSGEAALPFTPPTATQIANSPLGITTEAFNPSGGGYVGTIGGTPYGVSEEAYAAMSPAQKSAAKVASLEAQTKAIRDLRNARRGAEGSPQVGTVRSSGQQGGLTLASALEDYASGLVGSPGYDAIRSLRMDAAETQKVRGGRSKPTSRALAAAELLKDAAKGGGSGPSLSDQVSLANLQRGIANDQRAATQQGFQNQVSLENLAVNRAGEARQQDEAQRKADESARKSYLEAAPPFAQRITTLFPWMSGNVDTFFQQGAQIRPTNPAEAAGALQTVVAQQQNNPEKLMTILGKNLTGAEVVKLLNGDNPFGFGIGNDALETARQQAADKLQTLALMGLSQ